MTVREMIIELLRCPMDSKAVVRTAHGVLIPVADVSYYGDQAVLHVEPLRSDDPEIARALSKPFRDTVFDSMIGAVASVMHKAPEAFCNEPGCIDAARLGCIYCTEHDPFAGDPEHEADIAVLEARAARAALATREIEARTLRELAAA